MAYVTETYRLHYIAKDFKHGLTDVRMVVYKPNGVKQGIYALTELNAGDGKGIYYYDYVDSDLEGTYLFVVNSLSTPKKDARQVYFEKRHGWTEAERTQIRDALGVDGDKVVAVGGQLQQLQTIGTKVDSIKDDTTLIKTGINNLDLDLTNLHDDVNIMHQKVDDMSDVVNNIHGDLIGVSSDVIDVKNAVANIDSDLGAVAADVTDIKGDVAMLVADVQFIKDIEGGKWEIKNNQMIFYKSDNVTEVARFNLYNDINQPAMEHVFRRNRV